MLLVSILTLAGCSGYGRGPLDVTGQIEAETVEVGSKIGGRISEVLVAEGDHVKQGDVLVRLEATETDAALAAAKAKLDQAEATLAKLEAGARPEELRQAEAAAKRTEEQYNLAKKGFRSQEVKAASEAADAARAQRDEVKANFARIEKLYQGNAASQQLYDQAKHALEAAEAQYQVMQQKSGIAEEGMRSEEIAMAKAAYDQAAAALDLVRNGARKEDLDAARALRDAALADIQRAQSAADEMAVKAPRDAVVESLDVHPGDLVKPGAIVTLVDPEDLKIIVYVSSLMLGSLHADEKVALTTDAHGDEKFEGTIARIASQGEFTPRNLQTKEERAQQVFGVKIKLNSAGGKLRAGMTAIAHFARSEGKS